MYGLIEEYQHSSLCDDLCTSSVRVVFDDLDSMRDVPEDVSPLLTGTPVGRTRCRPHAVGRPLPRDTGEVECAWKFLPRVEKPLSLPPSVSDIALVHMCCGAEGQPIIAAPRWAAA